MVTKPSLSSLCASRAHCIACRALTPAGEQFRASLAASFAAPVGWPACPEGFGETVPVPNRPFPGATPLTIRQTLHGVTVQEPDAATLEQAKQYATALFTSPDVPADVAQERNDTCMGCEYARWSVSRNAPWCSICGCSVGAETKGFLSFFLKTLAQKAENLPKWGCKHPERTKGQGWKR